MSTVLVYSRSRARKRKGDECLSQERMLNSQSIIICWTFICLEWVGWHTMSSIWKLSLPSNMNQLKFKWLMLNWNSNTGCSVAPWKGFMVPLICLSDLAVNIIMFLFLSSSPWFQTHSMQKELGKWVSIYSMCLFLINTFVLTFHLNVLSPIDIVTLLSDPFQSGELCTTILWAGV